MTAKPRRGLPRRGFFSIHPVFHAKLKKDALAAEAEQRLAGTGWLPAILRSTVAATGEPAPEAIAAR
jgi:hypothetical protein